MSTQNFPPLDDIYIGQTRAALHAYSRVLGDWLKSCRPKRKHWWQASLRPSLTGLTTGVVHAETDFEIELNIRESTLSLRTAIGEQMWEDLRGQSAEELAAHVHDLLHSAGVLDRPACAAETRSNGPVFADYSPEEANKLAQTLNAVSATLSTFRASIREETSPVQLWPHHFDLSLLWLPGDKIPGQDPENEEYSDKQMNFGFTFGDAGIPEPYFYVTAYPLPDELPSLTLPTGTTWQTESFNGAVLTYKTLLECSDPAGYLLDLWGGLLSAGRKNMRTQEGI